MPATTAPPEAAQSHYLLASLLATRAATQATKVATRPTAVAQVIVQHQVTGAVLAERAVAAMLSEQGLAVAPDARLNPSAFTTDASTIVKMLDTASEFDRLVESLVRDATAAAETVAAAIRPEIGWVRHLNLPSCARCVVLAGRLYRYSDSFMRHPGDDCITVAVAEGDDRLVPDPLDLVRQGQVRGLSEADTKALEDGADFNQVVNVRKKAAGLHEAGRVLIRDNRLTPEAIYRSASTRDEAVSLLARYGYVI